MKKDLKDPDILARLRDLGSENLQVLFEFLGADRAAEIVAEKRSTEDPRTGVAAQ